MGRKPKDPSEIKEKKPITPLNPDIFITKALKYIDEDKKELFMKDIYDDLPKKSLFIKGEKAYTAEDLYKKDVKQTVKSKYTTLKISEINNEIKKMWNDELLLKKDVFEDLSKKTLVDFYTYYLNSDKFLNIDNKLIMNPFTGNFVKKGTSSSSKFEKLQNDYIYLSTNKEKSLVLETRNFMDNKKQIVFIDDCNDY